MCTHNNNHFLAYFRLFPSLTLKKSTIDSTFAKFYYEKFLQLFHFVKFRLVGWLVDWFVCLCTFVRTATTKAKILVKIFNDMILSGNRKTKRFIHIRMPCVCLCLRMRVCLNEATWNISHRFDVYENVHFVCENQAATTKIAVYGLKFECKLILHMQQQQQQQLNFTRIDRRETQQSYIFL